MMEAFDDLVRSGKVLYVGITDMPFWQFATAYFQAQPHGLGRALRLGAEPLQPAVARGRARAAAVLPRPGHRADPVQPDGARFSVRAGAPRRRNAAPSVRKPMTTPTSSTAAPRTRRWWIAVAAVADARGVDPGADRARLGAAPARRHRADHRRDAPRARRPGGCRPGYPPHAGGVCRITGALSAAAAPRLICPQSPIAAQLSQWDRSICRSSRSCLIS